MMKQPTKENVLKAYNETECLDIKKTLKTLWLEINGNPYRIGQIFWNDRKKYILAHIGGGLCTLIHLNSGNRYSETVQVKDCLNITEDEFQDMTGGDCFIEEE